MYLISVLAIFFVSSLFYLAGELELMLICFVVSGFYGSLCTPLQLNRRTFIGVDSALVGALTLYGFFVPFHQAIYQDGSEELISTSLYMYQMGVTGLCIGYQLFFWIVRNLPKNTRADSIYVADSATIYAGWTVLLWGGLFAFLAVLFTVGFDAYLNAGYAGRALIKRQAGPIELGLYHAVIGALIVFWFVNQRAIESGGYREYTGLSKIWLVVFFFAFIIYVSFLGIRRPTFFLVISFFALYVRQVSGLRAKYIVIFILVFLCFTLFAQFRQVLATDGASAAVSYIQENASMEWLDMSSTELGAPFRVLLDIQNEWSGEPGRLGYSYYQALVNIFPRQVGVNVFSLSEEYTFRLFSADFRAIGGNMGFSPVAEAYLNFGTFGVLPMFIFWGLVWASLSYYLDRKLTAMAQVTGAMLVPWAMFFCRTDFAAFVKVSFYSVVFPLIMFWIARYLYKKSIKRSSKINEFY